jgi:hypothetical protein
MKKTLKISGIIIGSLLLFLVAAALIIPVAFREKIKEKVESGINEMLNAKVTFADYKLSLLRSFPNTAFSMYGLNVTGTGQFEGDTLASFRSFGLIFNTLSIFGDEGYEIKSIIIDRPLINAIVAGDGAENWDIMKETPEAVVEDTAETLHATPLRVQLRKLVAGNGRLYYTDRSSDLSASLENLGFRLAGNMSGSKTDLVIDLTAGSVNLVMDKIRYLADARVDFHSDLDALIDSMQFTLRDNTLKINDISINFSGKIAMPGDDIDFDMTFNTPESTFKSLLSMIPAFYMKDFAELNTSGNFSLDGNVKGTYSSVDSTMPDITARLLVKDGVISYPDLPEKITAINISGEVVADGKDTDKSTVDISRFHFELAGNPFDMTLNLATPVSDPSVTASAKGKIDLSRLQQALLLDSLKMNGLVDVSMNLAGRMSMLENKQYDQFKADGSLDISDMALEMTDMPEIKIRNAEFTFSPEWSELRQLSMTMGKSDFSLSGKLGNYIPYLFSDGILKGNLALTSNSVDLNEILDIIPSDTSEVDTAAVELISVPKDIDFTFNTVIGKLVFNKLEASDVKGNIIVRDGVVSLNETGMKALGGSLVMNAAYNTRDTLKPIVDADVLISAVSIKEAFNTFNTVRKLMPIASGLGGNVSVRMKYNSLLGQNIMPVISTISGNGEINSESVQVLETKAFDQMKGLLKIDPSYTNTLKDIRATFIINDGRVYLKPFDTKLGNIKLNISGDQGLDQTLNYLIKTEIPRAELGSAASSLMGTLSAQAAAFGLNIPVPEIIKVNLKVGGTFKKPVITPVLAGGSGGAGSATPVTQAIKEEVTEKVNEAARQQADKILKEAGEKAQLLRDQAATSAETIRKEADLQGKKLIKEAESKGTIAVMAARRAADALNKEADRRAAQLVSEANIKADQILAEARAKADDLLR